MGYTHYWTEKTTNKKTSNEFVNVCKKLNKSLPMTSETAGGYHSNDKIVICGGNGSGKPMFTPNLISFNGDNETEMSHETFYVEFGDDEWNFCKTARKPYDLLVCACLIAAHEILGYEVTSDGDFEDWKPAIKFYLDTIYSGKEPDEKLMKKILPEFLFEDQKGTEYYEYKNKYSIMDYINSLFVESTIVESPTCLPCIINNVQPTKLV